MNEKKYLLPERLCKIDSRMSMDKLTEASKNRQPVVGIVKCWNAAFESLEVDLGGIVGYIPKDEISIYPIFKSNGKFSAEVFSLIGNPVLVQVLDTSSFILLSRKCNMEKAFAEIHNFFNVPINAYINANIRSGFFVDVGSGLYGLLNIKEYSLARLDNIIDLGNKPGDQITVVIKSLDEFNRCVLGHKELFPNLASKYTHGDIIVCTLLKPVPNTIDGYFCSINPNTTGIINVPKNITLPYGTKVIAVVRRITESGDKLKLNFISTV